MGKIEIDFTAQSDDLQLENVTEDDLATEDVSLRSSTRLQSSFEKQMDASTCKKLFDNFSESDKPSLNNCEKSVIQHRDIRLSSSASLCANSLKNKRNLLTRNYSANSLRSNKYGFQKPIFTTLDAPNEMDFPQAVLTLVSLMKENTAEHSYSASSSHDIFDNSNEEKIKPSFETPICDIPVKKSNDLKCEGSEDQCIQSHQILNSAQDITTQQKDVEHLETTRKNNRKIYLKLSSALKNQPVNQLKNQTSQQVKSHLSASVLALDSCKKNDPAVNVLSRHEKTVRPSTATTRRYPLNLPIKPKSATDVKTSPLVINEKESCPSIPIADGKLIEKLEENKAVTTPLKRNSSQRSFNSSEHVSSCRTKVLHRNGGGVSAPFRSVQRKVKTKRPHSAPNHQASNSSNFPLVITTCTTHTEMQTPGLLECQTIHKRFQDRGVAIDVDTVKRGILPPNECRKAKYEIGYCSLPKNTFGRLLSNPQHWLPKEFAKVEAARKKLQEFENKLIVQKKSEKIFSRPSTAPPMEIYTAFQRTSIESHNSIGINSHASLNVSKKGTVMRPASAAAAASERKSSVMNRRVSSANVAKVASFCSTNSQSSLHSDSQSSWGSEPDNLALSGAFMLAIPEAIEEELLLSTQHLSEYIDVVSGDQGLHNGLTPCNSKINFDGL